MSCSSQQAIVALGSCSHRPRADSLRLTPILAPDPERTRNRPRDRIAGVYAPIGSDNITLKSGVEIGKDMDSLRANLTLMYRF